jgi:lysophospholipase
MYFSPDDKMTSFEAGKQFADGCGSKDKTFKAWPGYKHELLNEPVIRDEIIGDYVKWVKTHAAI